MDLVAGVRKEGSRGGRGDFKWSDVKESSHRENYLGHSLMAPVGRWQQGRDLTWYAKGEALDEEEKARRDREEIKRIKEAEEEAMARALGLPIPPKSASATNANLTPLGAKDVQKAVRDTTADEDLANDGMGKGVGFGSYGGGAHIGGDDEKLEAVGLFPEEQRHRRRSRSPRREKRRDRNGSRDRERERRHRRYHDDRERHHHHNHRHRSRSRSSPHNRYRRRRRSGSRSRSGDSWREDDHKRSHRSGRDFPSDSRDHRSHRRERDHDYSRWH